MKPRNFDTAMLVAGCSSALLVFPSRVVRFVSFCHQSISNKNKASLVWAGHGGRFVITEIYL